MSQADLPVLVDCQFNGMLHVLFLEEAMLPLYWYKNEKKDSFEV